MGGRWSSTRGKVLAGIGAGVLGRWITPSLADEVTTGEPREQRFRALPARLGVYFVLGLCLEAGKPYRAVLKDLTAGLSGVLAAAGWQVPASTALTGLRRRLGEKPFELLFARLRGPLSPGRSSWSHVCGLLAVAWDGTTITVPASGENVAAFGRPGGVKEGHYPQIRLVTLIACGTRGVLGAVMGPLCGKGTGEQSLARTLYPRLEPDWLLMADRNFYNWQDWCTASDTGAALLWRVKSDLILDPLEFFPDGSYRSVVVNPKVKGGARQKIVDAARAGEDLDPEKARYVRVVEYEVPDRDGDGYHNRPLGSHPCPPLGEPEPISVLEVRIRNFVSALGSAHLSGSVDVLLTPC